MNAPDLSSIQALRIDPHLRCCVCSLPNTFSEESREVAVGDTCRVAHLFDSPLYDLHSRAPDDAANVALVLVHSFFHSLRIQISLRKLASLVELTNDDGTFSPECAMGVGWTQDQLVRLILAGALVPDSRDILWMLRRHTIKDFYLMLWGGLGDIICTTPLIEPIRERLPETRIHAVTLRRPDRALAEADPAIDTTIPRDELDIERNEDTLCFEPRVGILGIMQWEKRSITDVMADLLHLPLASTQPKLHLAQEHRQSALDLRDEIGEYVAVHASSRDEARNWPIEAWSSLIDRLPMPVVQVGGADDIPLPGAVDRRGTPFLTSTAYLERARCFIGINSAMQHACAAFDVPAVVIFGPSPPSIFAHSPHQVVQASSCACYRDLSKAVVCDGPCLNAIPPETVYRAFTSALEGA